MQTVLWNFHFKLHNQSLTSDFRFMVHTTNSPPILIHISLAKPCLETFVQQYAVHTNPLSCLSQLDMNVKYIIITSEAPSMFWVANIIIFAFRVNIAFAFYSNWACVVEIFFQLEDVLTINIVNFSINYGNLCWLFFL